MHTEIQRVIKPRRDDNAKDGRANSPRVTDIRGWTTWASEEVSFLEGPRTSICEALTVGWVRIALARPYFGVEALAEDFFLLAVR